MTALNSHEHNFQHPFGLDDNKNAYPTLESPVTLRYRDSVSSNASSLSRNSTMSSTDTRYFSASGPASPSSTLSSWSGLPSPLVTTLHRLERPSSLSPVHGQFPIEPHYSVIEPTGCFVPSKPLPFIQKTNVTRHHYIVPSFATVRKTRKNCFL